MTIEDIIKNDNIISLFKYGSHVYGTNTPKSDNDLIMVVKDDTHINDDFLMTFNKFGDLTIYSESQFQNQINEHEISVLECLFLEDKNIYKNKKDWNFNLNLQTLRNKISAKASNSWVKAKKKFIVEKDYNPYIGQKSAWHALRILNFGTQIALYGKIKNYQELTPLYKDILSLEWDEINNKYKSLYNELASKFREVAPKEIALESKSKTNKI